ncbi:MAG: prolipoprotein diacylglyceryl transferase [Dysgonamonadaceae bacterium]
MLLSITWDVSPTLFNLFGRDVRWYGLLWAIGLIAAVSIVQRIFKSEKIADKWFESLFTYIIIGIIAGARLGHCLFYDPGYYLSHPLKILAIWEGGLASHGGVIGIIIAVYLYSRNITHLSMLWTFDRIVVPAGLTAALIRVGNLMNSEIYGGPTDLPWGFNFINDKEWALPFSEGGSAGLPCHPTQIYEAIIYLIIFGISAYLYWKTNAKEKQGYIIGVAMIGIFVARFLIEYLKNIQEPFELSLRSNIGMDMGQLLSIPFIIWGIWLIYNANRKKTITAATTNTHKSKN